MGRLIAITGGIGSGKSVVSKMLLALGQEVYDCDSRAKLIMDLSNSIKCRIAKEISEDVVRSDGSIDRPLLASLVFNDEVLLNKLNVMVHQAVKDDIVAWSIDKPTAFVETAILYQSGLDRLVDEVWDVMAPREIRIRRVMNRNHLCAEAVISRIESQDSFVPDKLHDKIMTIINDGDVALLPQVERLLKSQVK